MRGLPEVRGRARRREVVRALVVWSGAAEVGRGVRRWWGASWRSATRVVPSLRPRLRARRWPERP